MKEGNSMEVLEILKALSDENRLRILNLLRWGKLCVGEIQSILGITQSNASRHLNKLKGVGIIKFEKDAQWVHYKLDEDFISKYPFLGEMIYNQLQQMGEYRGDVEKLAAYKVSGCNCQDLREADFDLEKLDMDSER